MPKEEEYERYVNRRRQANEIAVFPLHAYTGFAVPKKSDVIFQADKDSLCLTNLCTKRDKTGKATSKPYRGLWPGVGRLAEQEAGNEEGRAAGHKTFLKKVEACCAPYRHKVVLAREAVYRFAVSALRNITGRHSLDGVLKEREQINTTLQKIVDQTTEPWGVKIERVEMKDVEIPEGMQRAMAREAEAIREKRARLVKAEAEPDASITNLRRVHNRWRATPLRWS